MGDNTVPNILQDQSMQMRWQEIDDLEQIEKDRILSVLDSLVRDAKTRLTYRASA